MSTLKLVRNLVPKIMEAKGMTLYLAQALPHAELRFLLEKVIEEAQESLVELGDTPERHQALLNELADLGQVTMDLNHWLECRKWGTFVENRRLQYKRERGGFNKFFILDLPDPNERQGPTTLYVGSALTHASKEYKERIGMLKDVLRAKGYNVLEYLGTEKGTCRDVWNWDMKGCIPGCDLFVAVADLPSIGLGIEIGLMIGRHEGPVLIVSQEDAPVTRAIQDPDEKDVTFRRYEDMLIDIPRLVEEKIASIPKLARRCSLVV